MKEPKSVWMRITVLGKQEWLKFLKKIDRETHDDLDLHLIADHLVAGRWWR